VLFDDNAGRIGPTVLQQAVRCAPGITLKIADQVSLVVITAVVGDLRPAGVAPMGGGERVIEANDVRIGLRRQADLLTETPDQMLAAEAGAAAGTASGAVATYDICRGLCRFAVCGAGDFFSTAA